MPNGSAGTMPMSNSRGPLFPPYRPPATQTYSSCREVVGVLLLLLLLFFLPLGKWLPHF